ncbi:hypothetical protein BpHYR1_016616 [Brachionus plicatilis]|uniref:Uncharacterized protein n=1 Tax=Brachionus plicatilis TaxID=10195 RepID=A0A3M7SKN7_BRAPC|nr:hypothetical protein BpHYR1_016616 [Brachionus plicatilis]
MKKKKLIGYSHFKVLNRVLHISEYQALNPLGLFLSYGSVLHTRIPKPINLDKIIRNDLLESLNSFFSVPHLTLVCRLFSLGKTKERKKGMQIIYSKFIEEKNCYSLALE